MVYTLIDVNKPEMVAFTFFIRKYLRRKTEHLTHSNSK
jgi:hypothetical protein